MHSSVQPKPILNASLPAAFRQIHIALAREPGHPEGETDVAYIMVAPLDIESRIDAKVWRKHREACQVARFRRTSQTSTVISSTSRVAAGYSATKPPKCLMRSDFTSPTNASRLANTSRSMRAERCIPIGWYRYRTSSGRRCFPSGK